MKTTVLGLFEQNFNHLLRHHIRTGHGTTIWLKLGKEYVKAEYCHPAYLTYMQSTLCKMPG